MPSLLFSKPDVANMSTQLVSKNHRCAGCPTQEETSRLDKKLKNVALDVFLELGYTAAIIKAIAPADDITKPTLYAR